jgi:hypothetical protein
VALSAIRVDADNSLRSLDPENVRKCYFEDETSSLKFHKRYSQANCFLECSLENAQSQLSKYNYRKCTPWYFPNNFKESVICDPWGAMLISKGMQDLKYKCKKCFPGEALKA